MKVLFVLFQYELASNSGTEGVTMCSDDEYHGMGQENRGSHMSVSSEPMPSQRNKEISSLYHGTWPVERTMWNSEPISLGNNQPAQHNHAVRLFFYKKNVRFCGFIEFTLVIFVAIGISFKSLSYAVI